MLSTICSALDITFIAAIFSDSHITSCGALANCEKGFYVYLFMFV